MTCLSPGCPVCRDRRARRLAISTADLVYERTHADGWVTSSDVAKATFLHRRTAGEHLKAFVRRGLIEERTMPGRGGPAGYRRVA